MTDNRREKSLGLLTQNFIKLFICSEVSEKFKDSFFELKSYSLSY